MDEYEVSIVKSPELGAEEESEMKERKVAIVRISEPGEGEERKVAMVRMSEPGEGEERKVAIVRMSEPGEGEERKVAMVRMSEPGEGEESEMRQCAIHIVKSPDLGEEDARRLLHKEHTNENESSSSRTIS